MAQSLRFGLGVYDFTQSTCPRSSQYSSDFLMNMCFDNGSDRLQKQVFKSLQPKIETMYIFQNKIQAELLETEIWGVILIENCCSRREAWN